jgi:hypothetical protein
MNSTAWTSNICELAGIACATNRTLTINRGGKIAPTSCRAC